MKNHVHLKAKQSIHWQKTTTHTKIRPGHKSFPNTKIIHKVNPKIETLQPKNRFPKKSEPNKRNHSTKKWSTANSLLRRRRRLRVPVAGGHGVVQEVAVIDQFRPAIERIHAITITIHIFFPQSRAKIRSRDWGFLGVNEMAIGIWGFLGEEDGQWSRDVDSATEAIGHSGFATWHGCGNYWLSRNSNKLLSIWVAAYMREVT